MLSVTVPLIVAVNACDWADRRVVREDQAQGEYHYRRNHIAIVWLD